MQRIEIKNFGPIKEMSLEIKDFNLLIGPQASGKSTVAALVWYFRNFFTGTGYFPSFFMDDALRGYNAGKIQNAKKIFIDLFGVHILKQDFEVIFYWESGCIKIDSNNETLNIHFDVEKYSYSETIYREHQGFDTDENGVTINLGLLEEINEEKFQVWRAKLKNDFGQSITDDALFTPAIRYHLTKQKQEEERTNEISYRKNQEEISRFYSKYNGDIFQSLIEELGLKVKNNISEVKEPEQLLEKLRVAKSLSEKILRGKYAVNGNGGEGILTNEGFQIHISRASSGQQEVIAILADVFLALYRGSKHFKIIEEPESHLFPESQKGLMELFALYVNQVQGAGMFLTTHSPYMLSVLNNMIYAGELAKEKGEDEVAAIIPKDFWLTKERVNVMYLHDGIAEKVWDEELGLIGENQLDSVSESIGTDFQRLLNLKYQKIKA